MMTSSGLTIRPTHTQLSCLTVPPINNRGCARAPATSTYGRFFEYRCSRFTIVSSFDVCSSEHDQQHQLNRGSNNDLISATSEGLLLQAPSYLRSDDPSLYFPLSADRTIWQQSYARSAVVPCNTYSRHEQGSERFRGDNCVARVTIVLVSVEG